MIKTFPTVSSQSMYPTCTHSQDASKGSALPKELVNQVAKKQGHRLRRGEGSLQDDGERIAQNDSSKPIAENNQSTMGEVPEETPGKKSPKGWN